MAECEREDWPLLHRVQAVYEEMRSEWTHANYAATYLNSAVPTAARFEFFKFAQYGGL